MAATPPPPGKPPARDKIRTEMVVATMPPLAVLIPGDLTPCLRSADASGYSSHEWSKSSW